jgi:hypothetical protein
LCASSLYEKLHSHSMNGEMKTEERDFALMLPLLLYTKDLHMMMMIYWNDLYIFLLLYTNIIFVAEKNKNVFFFPYIFKRFSVCHMEHLSLNDTHELFHDYGDFLFFLTYCLLQSSYTCSRCSSIFLSRSLTIILICSFFKGLSDCVLNDATCGTFLNFHDDSILITKGNIIANHRS